MSSDDRTTRQDVPFRHAGVGMHLGFICPKCGIRREMGGRRLLRLQGVRQWVCKACLPGKKP